MGRRTSVARRTVSVRSPMRMPLRPAHAMSVTDGSRYTTKPYLRTQAVTLRPAAPQKVGVHAPYWPHTDTVRACP